jgi:hypothetical protein
VLTSHANSWPALSVICVSNIVSNIAAHRPSPSVATIHHTINSLSSFCIAAEPGNPTLTFCQEVTPTYLYTQPQHVEKSRVFKENLLRTCLQPAGQCPKKTQSPVSIVQFYYNRSIYYRLLSFVLLSSSVFSLLSSSQESSNV